MFRFITTAISLLIATPALAQEAPDSPRSLAKDLRKDWDLLGVQVDATSSHSLAVIGPRYQLFTQSGLYLEGAGGVGFTVRDVGPSTFGQGHAYAGWSLIRGMKNKDTLFNLYEQSASDASGTTTTYEYLETEVIAQRNVIVFGGARTIVGRGPDLSDGTVAPGYFSMAGGVAFLTTWREVQERNGVRRMMRGVQGFELTALYTPQVSESEGFSNFRHVGGELKIHKTAELGRLAAPFSLSLGIEPGLGPMLGIGMLWPVVSPIAGSYGSAKVGEVRK